MIGQGLNSLIPPKDPNRENQQPASANVPANQEPSATRPAEGHFAHQSAPVSHTPVQPASPTQFVPPAQPQTPAPAPRPEVAEVIHVDPEQLRADEHAEIVIDSIRAMEHPHVVGISMTPEERAEIADDVAYHALDHEEHEHVTKRAAGFSKRTALGDAIFHIEVDKIKPNPYQPRKYFDETALKDLTNSIREFGILQPLVVSKIETETEHGTKVEYQLIAGERRLMASKRAGLERVPVIIRQAAERAEQLELAIIENLQRENLDTIETARSYARLQDEFGMTQREVAARLGKSREVVGNALRLLSLPVEIQDALAHNQINESQARLLLSVSNMTVQKQLFADLLTKNFSVRELKAKIKSIHNPPVAHERPAFAVHHDEDLELRELQNRLKDSLGTDVKIERRGESGKIVISFYSHEELYGVVRRINPRME